MKKHFLFLLMGFILWGMSGCQTTPTPSLDFASNELTVNAYDTFTLIPLITNGSEDLAIEYSIGDASLLSYDGSEFYAKKAGNVIIIASLAGFHDTRQYIFVRILAQTEYSLSYVLNGGGLKLDSPVTYSAGLLPMDLPRPIKSGYVFMGWYLTSDFSGADFFSLPLDTQGDKIFYAKWE